MAENSNIEWCHHTVNLWWGCSKVHTGCKNCYAEKTSKRFQDGLWGEKGSRRIIMSAFKDLDRYERKAVEIKIKQVIFVGSMMDIFEEPKPLIDKEGGPIISLTTGGKVQMQTSHIRNLLFDLITRNKYEHLIFLFLTKRPENITRFIPQKWLESQPDNVWFGTSVSNQRTWCFAETLRSLPLRNKFVSMEPQTGLIDHVDLTGIDWLIQGGESGPKKRAFRLEWAYRMQQNCIQQRVPYFFKQVDKVSEIPPGLRQRNFPEALQVENINISYDTL